MRRFVSSSLLAGLLLFQPGAPVASAQSVQPGTFNISPFLGFSFASGEGTDASLALGVAFAYDWTSAIGFEFELSHLPDIVDDDLTQDLDASVTTFGGNVLYHFKPIDQVVPYVTAGAGFGRIKFSFEDVDGGVSDTELAANFGGGLKYSLNDRTSIRGDLRFFKIAEEDAHFWRLYGGVTIHLAR